MNVVVNPVSADGELTEEELMRISLVFKLLREDYLWIRKNYDKLRKKYSCKYIAVRRGKVVNADKNLSRLISNLKKEFGDINDITIEYLGKKPLKLLM